MIKVRLPTVSILGYEIYILYVNKNSIKGKTCRRLSGFSLVLTLSMKLTKCS